MKGGGAAHLGRSGRKLRGRVRSFLPGARRSLEGLEQTSLFESDRDHAGCCVLGGGDWRGQVLFVRGGEVMVVLTALGARTGDGAG